MDKLTELFGDSLLKYQEPEAAPEGENPEGEEGAPKTPKTKPVYFTSTPTSEALASENLRYIGVIFSAKYCPPCERL